MGSGKIFTRFNYGSLQLKLLKETASDKTIIIKIIDPSWMTIFFYSIIKKVFEFVPFSRQLKTKIKLEIKKIRLFTNVFLLSGERSKKKPQVFSRQSLQVRSLKYFQFPKFINKSAPRLTYNHYY